MERSNTKFLTIMNRSRQQNLRQAENITGIASVQRNANVTSCLPKTHQHCLTGIPLHIQTRFSRQSKTIEYEFFGFDDVERMQPRLSNQEGVNNCFLSKLQSFVHANDDLWIEYSCFFEIKYMPPFPFQVMEMMSEFILLLFFIYDCKLAWEIAGQNFPYIMV